jgi:ATP-binding cassette subfamily C protein LapB
LDNVDMMHLAPEYVREQIGYLTQDVRLFSGTLRDNLVMGLPSPTDEQVLQAAAQTGLDQLIKSHPAGLGLPIYEGGRGLSGGQRQLVGLTRMLIARPSILLLDEPTASLDGDLEVKVMQTLFQNVSPETVVVLATHKRSLLGLVNRIIVMNKGRIVLDGPRDEVLAKLSRPAPAAPRPTPTLEA